MGAAAFHLDKELSPFSERSYSAGDDSDVTRSSQLDIKELQRLGALESLSWSNAGTFTPVRSIPSRRVISGLIKRAIAGGAALDFLPQDDREWVLDNLRLLRTALREVVESHRGPARRPQVQGRDGHTQLRSQVIADAFWRSTGFSFDPDAFVAYLDGWQQNQTLQMNELPGLRTALQVSVLDALAEAVAPALERPASGVLTTLTGRFSIPRLITALRDVGQADWEFLSDQTSVVDHVLRRDPAGSYAQMTKESRALYRSVIADLACRSDFDECQVAEAAVSLAEAAARPGACNSCTSDRQVHVGCYLLGEGLPKLRSAIGYRPGLKRRFRDLLRTFPNGFYLVSIEACTLLIVVLVLAGLHHLSPVVASFFFLLIPASQAAVEIVNAVVTAVLPARPLPKLDFSEGIPDQFKTMVAVPALLLNEREVQHLLEGIEIRYLANRDRNVYFALLTDSPDSHERFDGKEALAGLCGRGIRELNRKYGVCGAGPFFLFHRLRTFNASQNTWMGWERKRGKLLDLSRLLRGDEGRFSTKVGDLSILPQIRYVITLDADTQLPRDAAHRLVGTLAHPLNRAVIDPVTNTVTRGYGVLQPRVGISVQSASRSWLASIYSGQTGFDIYTRAVSDVYQDLYGEGIFAGKGIFDVDVFQHVLSDRFPCNTLLSHDLIEGAYTRAALVSDIEVIEDYPSHFSAYSRRKHRWVRGDWQISQWLFPRVPDFRGRMVPNPINVVSRWKIFDNLRRSLVDPCLFALLLAGWFILPGHAWYWTTITALLLVFPGHVQALISICRIRDVRHLRAAFEGISADLMSGYLNALVILTFLPHQALVMIDAIIRTIVRHRFTGRRLLEWETAAEAESGRETRRPADTYLAWTPWMALGLAVTLAFTRPEVCPYALPFLLVWAAAPSIARWLSREKAAGRVIITSHQKRFLRTSAMHMWRYFHENGGPAENWLIPDNVQEDASDAAHRASPTNLGLLLNARLAACEMGYLTLPEFVTATASTLSTMALLPKHRGHFLNWYDTRSLQPLNPPAVSTVDSGNLAVSLWTLKQGCLALSKQPIFGKPLWQGLLDHVCILRDLDRQGARDICTVAQVWGTDGRKWLTGVDGLKRAVQPLLSGSSESARHWATSLVERVTAVRALADTLAPWFGVLGERTVRELLGDPEACLAELTLDRVSVLADRFRGTLKSPQFAPLNDAMLRAAMTAETLQSELMRLAADADRLVDEMDFRFLYDERRKLLAVGYDVADQKLDAARYGLLASEARMAAFVAVAKGDIPQDSWFHLGRSQTCSGGWRVLLSWTGTMFEYLMPTLWMRSYPRTILEQSSRAAVEIQRAYGRKMRMPWGVSESAYSVTDRDGFYQYRAFGLPEIALKRARSKPRVSAPYAAFLALAVRPAAAIRNLQRMRNRGWWGRYGLYEAVEFPEREKPAPVRCWMAHHQGMSLLAIVNCLSGSPFQRLFHSVPQVMATELLLHEKVPMGVRVRREPYFDPPTSVQTATCTPGNVSVHSLLP